MSSQTIKMNVAVTITTRATSQWMGKRDSEGNIVNETTWAAEARVYGTKIAETEFANDYSTEKGAITAVKQLVREL